MSIKPKWKCILNAIVCAALFFGTLSTGSTQERLKVIVSIVPQIYFVEKIGGEQVDVTAMVRPGSSPHIYEPRPQQMASLTRAKVYFAVGVPFEAVWLKRFARANPRMKIVHTREGIQRRSMGGASHTHEGDAAENHREKDPHIWLSPPLVMIQARHILTGLMQADPEHGEIYKTNYRTFLRELADLDLRLVDIFSIKKKDEIHPFLVFHPSWGYFAEAYGLTQFAIEKQGKEPSAKELLAIIRKAKANNIQVMFMQPQISAKSGRAVADAIGCKIVIADPLAEDWANNLLKIADLF